MRARTWLVVAGLAALTALPACRSGAGSAGPAPRASASAPGAAAGSESAASSAAAPVPLPEPTPAPTRTPPPEPVPSVSVAAARDGGAAGGCRVLRGPIELPVRSPAALVVRGETLEAVLNEDGKPRTSSYPAGPVPAPAPVSASAAASASAPAREPAEGGSAAGYAVACAVAGDRVFCPDHTGAVHRAGRDGSGDRIVASSRTGSRIGAAPLAGSHAALAYLASRQTSEGWVSEAWLAVDDEVPVRLSEEGSGATSLSLGARGAAVVALSVDARAALTAVHARSITYEGRGKLGEDAVVFVGGPGDRRTAAALAAVTQAPSWALLPISRDVGSFGLAVVRVDDPARVDEPVVWSMYPNGCDPAPVAAAVDGARVWVARVRPVEAKPGSSRILEIGSVGRDGAFTPSDVVTPSGRPTDVALAVDAHGAQWLAWADGAGSWLERIACR